MVVERRSLAGKLARHHNKSLIIKTNFLNDADFIVRMLYKYSY